jgi:hypothetical protein
MLDEVYASKGMPCWRITMKKDEDSQEEQVTWIDHRKETKQVQEYFWRKKDTVKKTNIELENDQTSTLSFID